jgi:hypothetical protein
VSRQARAFGFATANAARRWAGQALTDVPTKEPRTSWWLDATQANFTAKAEQEREAMDRGTFGRNRRPSMPEDRRRA